MSVVDHIEPSAEFLPPKNRLQQIKQRVGEVVCGAAIALELNPITNEGMRLAAFAATEAVADSPVVSAAAFTAATFAIEAGGAVGTAKLLHTQRGNRLTEKVNQFTNKFRRGALRETNLATDAAIGMVAGSPLLVAIKHQQDPTRSEAQDRKYGLVSSALISAATGAEAYLASKGMATPNALTISGALAGFGVCIGAIKWARERLKDPTISYENYREAMDITAEGAHIEGYSTADFEKVRLDAKTRFVTGKFGKKEGRWPLLSPIINSTEYMPNYFSEHYGSNEMVYYMSMPNIDTFLQDERVARQVADELVKVSKEGGIIVFDELVGQDKAHKLHQLVERYYGPTEVQTDGFVDSKNGTPAASIHYAGLVQRKDISEGEHSDRKLSVGTIKEQYREMVARGEITHDPQNGSILLDSDTMDSAYKSTNDMTLVDRLWEIYEQRFTWLIEENPTRGAQTRDELEAMLKDPSTLVAARMVDGEVAAFTMLVSNIEACDWLRPEFYSQRFPRENLLYFPGIASDESLKGGRFSLDMINLLTKVVASNVDQTRIVWQCTNVSSGYIPRLVSMGISASETMHMNGVEETLQYNYRGIHFKVNED